MRRRPQEQHDGERKRQRPQRFGRHRRGAGEHGEAAGEAADHDVQPGPALEPDRVDDAVGERAEERVERRHRIERVPGQRDAGGADREDREQPRAPGDEAARDERAAARPAHARIEVALDVLIERAGGRRGHRHGRGEQHDVPRGKRGTRRDRGACHGREADDEADPQLEQVEEQADPAAETGRWCDCQRCFGAWGHGCLGFCAAARRASRTATAGAARRRRACLRATTAATRSTGTSS